MFSDHFEASALVAAPADSVFPTQTIQLDFRLT